MKKVQWLIVICIVMSMLIGCRVEDTSKDYSGEIEKLHRDIEGIKAGCQATETNNVEIGERLALIDAEIEKLKEIPPLEVPPLEVPPLEVLENEGEDFEVLKELYRSLYEKVAELQGQVQIVEEPEEEEQRGLEDVEYVTLEAKKYTIDDADPDVEGVMLDIVFYNSEGKRLVFHDMPVNVEVELYRYDTKGNEWRLIWFQEDGIFSQKLRVTINNSGENVKIPYDSIVETEASASYPRKMEITITTPQGKKFLMYSNL